MWESSLALLSLCLQNLLVEWVFMWFRTGVIRQWVLEEEIHKANKVVGQGKDRAVT